MYGDIIILQENFAPFYMPHNCTKDYPGYILRDQFSCLMGAQLGMKVSCKGLLWLGLPLIVISKSTRRGYSHLVWVLNMCLSALPAIDAPATSVVSFNPLSFSQENRYKQRLRSQRR
jgi:hypothetical protein